ncbi:hypothetical protein [Kutzneria sp. NPDC051319]
MPEFAWVELDPAIAREPAVRAVTELNHGVLTMMLRRDGRTVDG